MEGHAAEDTRVSERDVNRVEKGIREGRPVEEVYPRLRAVTTVVAGHGPSITVNFVMKKKGGIPVTYTSADDPHAAAVREVDLQKKFHWPANDLARKLGLTPPKATALRRHLAIDDDPASRYEFTFGSQKIVRYSDNAYLKMKNALDGGVDMDEVWREHGSGRGRKPAPIKSSSPAKPVKPATPPAEQLKQVVARRAGRRAGARAKPPARRQRQD